MSISPPQISGPPIRPMATRLHQLGFNINLLGSDKQPIHRWKSTPDYTTARQTAAQFADLPWKGYTRKRDDTVIPPPVGVAVLKLSSPVFAFATSHSLLHG